MTGAGAASGRKTRVWEDIDLEDIWVAIRFFELTGIAPEAEAFFKPPYLAHVGDTLDDELKVGVAMGSRKAPRFFFPMIASLGGLGGGRGVQGSGQGAPPEVCGRLAGPGPPRMRES